MNARSIAHFAGRFGLVLGTLLFAPSPALADEFLDLAYDHPEIPNEMVTRPVVTSPDGRQAIYSVLASSNPESGFGGVFLKNGTPNSIAGMQLFHLDLTTRKSRRICASAGTDWDPTWSPDGRQIVFFSDRSGSVRLWSYEPESDRCRMLSDIPVKVTPFPFQQPQWSPDGATLFVAAWPERGVGSLGTTLGHLRTGGRAPAPDASGITVFRHDPGVVAQAAGMPRAEDAVNRCRAISYMASSIMAIRLSDGASRRVLDPIQTTGEGRTLGHYVSPFVRVSSSGRWLSYTSSACLAPGSRYEMRQDLYVVPVAGGTPRLVATGLRAPGGGTEFDFSHRWNPARDELVFVREGKLFRVPVSAEGPGEPVPLAQTMGHVAPHLLHLLPDGSAALVGVVGDPGRPRDLRPNVALVDLAAASAKLFTIDPDWQIQQIVSGERRTAWAPTSGHALARARNLRTGEAGLIDLDFASVTGTPVWRGDASIAALAPAGGTLLGSYQDFSTPPQIVRFPRGLGTPQLLAEVAPQLRRLATGSKAMFETVVPFHDGTRRTVRTTMIMPPGAKRGDKVPAIVLFYPGSDYSNFANVFGAPPMGDLAFAFTRRGYGVLLASVPLGPGNAKGNILDEVADALLPQVYKAGDLGYVDIERLALRGQSFGGFATAGIVSKTNLFKAAIPSSSPYDLGGFVSAVEYGETEPADFGSWAETSQPRLGGALWDDRMRYLENSAYYRAAQIRTPMLIIQGTADVIGFHEAGKLYGALRRLDRDVELALYDGGQHSPPHWKSAHASDQMRRTLDFLDKHLGGGWQPEPTKRQPE